jgi:hypothetical protein
MMVFDEFKYKDKVNTLLESGAYEPLPKDPTAEVERKLQKLLSKHKTTLLIDLKYKPTPYHSKPLHLYSLPRIHKPDIPLRPIVSSIGFLHKILGPLAGKSKSFVKNSGHFVRLLKSVNLQSPDTLISFYVISPFTNVPVDKTLQVMGYSTMTTH